MAIDETSIERIREATFPSSWAWRGYDKGEVEKFLAALADWLQENGGGGVDTNEQDTSEQELSVQGSAIESMEEKIRELERELANAGRRERRLAEKLEKAQVQTRARKTRPSGATQAQSVARTTAARRRRKPTTESWAKLPRGKLDVNEASFEQFRALGLSVSQCARLIATRDIRGGFKSLEEIDEIDGMSPSAIEKLNERATIREGEPS